MADAELDAVQREFAGLTGLFEESALVASAGQGAKNLDEGRCRLGSLSKSMNRIQSRLSMLEERMQ